MNEDNSYRRFRANPVGKQPHSGNNAKDLPINKSPDHSGDRNADEMKKGNCNILVTTKRSQSRSNTLMSSVGRSSCPPSQRERVLN